MQRLWLMIKRNRLFVSILFSGIVVAVLSVAIVSMVASFNLKNMLRDELIQWKRNNLSMVQNGVEIYLEQISSNCNSLMMSSVITEYETPLSPSELINTPQHIQESKLSEKRGRLSKLMAGYVISNSAVYNIYFYDVANGRIITSEGMEFDAALFSDRDWISYAQESQVFPMRLETRELYQYRSGFPKSVVSIIVRTLNGGNYVVVNIDAQKLVDKAFGNSVGEEDSHYFLCRLDGSISLSSDAEEYYHNFPYISEAKQCLDSGQNYYITNGKAYFFSYSDSLDSYFFTSGDAQLLNGQTGSFSWLYYAVVAAVLLLAVLVLSATTTMIYRPVKNLVERVGENAAEARTGGELQYIENAYTEIQSDCIELTEKMSYMKPFVQSTLLNRILFKRSGAQDEIDKLAADYGLSIPKNEIAVMVFDIERKGQPSPEQQYRMNLKCIGSIQSTILSELNGLVSHTDHDLVCIVEVAPDGAPFLRHKANEVARALSLEEGFTCTVGISRIYADLSQASLAYEEAVAAVRYKVVYGEGGAIAAEQVQISKSVAFRYPAELEEQMIEYIILGENNKAAYIAQRIVESIMSPENGLSMERIRQLLFVLFGNLIQQMSGMGLEMSEITSNDMFFYESLIYVESKEDTVNIFRRLIDKIGEHVTESNTRKKNDNVSIILKYIDENYTQNVSLDQISAHVYLNPSYISRLIKQETGCTFTDYLLTVRMRRAKQLLNGSRDKVETVAVKSGFNNTNYFIKLFRQQYGCTPGEYRKKGGKGLGLTGV